MAHATVRATNIPEIVRLISENMGLPEEAALDAFYRSATGASYADDETGLYGQSALYVYGLFADETAAKKKVVN
ncbi:MAG: hypothetical protein LUD69_08645 [Oscillospiraceae bacterium]|nr:hypothetical protein [Oscillospiraceae bacterium]